MTQSRRSEKIIFTLVMCCIWFLPAMGRSEETPSDTAQFTRIELPPEQVFEGIRQLIMTGRLEEASRLLALLENTNADQIQIRFLRGIIAGTENKWPEAIQIFRAILAERPELLRVRLELARAFYELRDNDNAKRQFELVLASKELPGKVRQNIHRFLTKIYLQKKWTLNLSLSAAPDTNINSATASDKVMLYGLPFELSDEARKSSGVGFSGEVGASYRMDIKQGLAMDTGLQIRHTEYLSGTEFDNTMMNGRVGPRFYWSKTEIRLALTGGYARFANKELYKSWGGQLSIYHQLTDILTFSTVLGVEKLDFNENSGRSGHLYNWINQLSYVLNQRSSMRVSAGIVIDNEKNKTLASTTYRAGAGYGMEFTYGLTVNLNADYNFRPFKEFSPVFSEKRSDQSIGLGVSVIKRDLSLWGFAPVIGYQYLHNSSNIDLFSYNRHRWNIGLTRIF